MNVGVAHSDPNPNSTYFNSKGMWVTYVIVVVFVHYIFLSLPFLSVAMAWTLTNIFHNTVCAFLMFVVSDENAIIYLKHFLSNNLHATDKILVFLERTSTLSCLILELCCYFFIPRLHMLHMLLVRKPIYFDNLALWYNAT